MTLMPSHNTNMPDQEELIKKRCLLEELEEEYSARQLEYATLAGEIAAFRGRYYLRVGYLYARLDTLRAEIKEIIACRNPDDLDARQEAEKARRQADDTDHEVNGVKEDEHVVFTPSSDLKQAYRQAAKLIHPDRARDEGDRQLRDCLMAEVNTAYAAGNIETIRDVIERYRDQLEPAETDDIGAQLFRVIRNIARTRNGIAGLVKAIADLQSSDWFNLKTEIEKSEADGKDPLGKMAEKIHVEIIEEQKRLNELSSIEKAENYFNCSSDGGSPLPPSHPLECWLELSQTDSPQSGYTGTEPQLGSQPQSEMRISSPILKGATFRPEGLIHRTERGEKVRSKSEAIIANILHNLELDYCYEYPIEGHARSGIRRPDFTFFTVNKKPIIWEHLGMLDDPDYQERWKSKQVWYEANGFTQGVDFFVTRDQQDGGLDSYRIRKLAEYIKTLVVL